MRDWQDGNFPWLPVTVAALVPVAIVARADVYLTDEQAARLLFPEVKLTRKVVSISDAHVAAIEKASSESVKSKRLITFVSPAKDCVFVDQVLGKHELITIAVGVEASGKVRGVEILEYRETYGYQVRNPDWRKQFAGKDKDAPLKLGTDIKNISGATLSSAHVTAGVRRLVQTYAVLRSDL